MNTNLKQILILLVVSWASYEYGVQNKPVTKNAIVKYIKVEDTKMLAKDVVSAWKMCELYGKTELGKIFK